MTLHKPQKDSPSTFLTESINQSATTLAVVDSAIFQDQPLVGNVTRLTLGFDTATTETVTVVSYGSSNRITVQRGAPSYSWPVGTKIARVLTAQDILDIHIAINDLDAKDVTNGNLHNHQSGDGGQIPTAGIQDGAITADKIQNRRRRVHLSSTGNGLPASSGTFITGQRIKYSPTEDAKQASFNGIVPKDFLSDGILYVLISNFIHMTAVDAYINVGVTRFSIDSNVAGFMDLETTLNIPGFASWDPNYTIRTKAIPLENIAPDDYITGGVRLGSEAGEVEVIYQGAYLDYLADS